MRTVLNAILKFIAFLLAIFAIFATTFVLLFLSFNQILLNPQTYKQALTENNVYEQLPAVTAQEFTLIRDHLVETCDESVIANSCLDSTVSTPLPGESTENARLGFESRAFISALREDQWKNLVLYLLTPEVVQKNLETGINEIIAYFKGQTNRAGIPLLDMKARLMGMTDEELTRLLLNSQPACTVEQQTIIMSGSIREAGTSPIFCATTGGTSQVLVLDLQSRLNSVADELPEKITVIKAPSPSNLPKLQSIIGKDLQSTLQRLQSNAQYLPLLPVALLLLATVFGVRSLRGLLRWWGIPIFIASFLALIFGIALFFLFDQLWSNYILSSFPPILTSGIGEIIYDVAHSLSKDVAQHLMTQTAILMSLALGILFVSNRVPPPPDPSLPPLAQPGTPGGPVLNPNQKKKKW